MIATDASLQAKPWLLANRRNQFVLLSVACYVAALFLPSLTETIGHGRPVTLLGWQSLFDSLHPPIGINVLYGLALMFAFVKPSVSIRAFPLILPCVVVVSMLVTMNRITQPHVWTSLNGFHFGAAVFGLGLFFGLVALVMSWASYLASRPWPKPLSFR